MLGITVFLVDEYSLFVLLSILCESSVIKMVGGFSRQKVNIQINICMYQLMSVD